MEQQDLHLQRLGLGSLASNQVGSWGASQPSSLQDQPLESQDACQVTLSWWAACWQGGWQKNNTPEQLSLCIS